MFGKSTEKRVAREADKIVSLKEDMDAISWTRVLEIGKLLQEGVEEADRVALARELVSIAQSNRSLYTRLGIEPAPAPARVMASGIEVLEGGLAEAAIEERVEQVEKRALPPVAVPSPAEPEPRADEPSEIDFQAAEVQVECDLVAKNDPDEDDFAEAAHAATAGEPAPAPVQAPAPAPEPEPDKPLTIDELIAAATQLEEAVDELEAAAAEIDEPAASEAPVTSDDPTEPLQPVAAAPEPAPQSEQTPEPEPALQPEPQAKPQPKLAKKRRFARFRNLYESRDGGLCVFEDEHGHLVAVDSSKLA
ncbi:hypothetical protein GS424_005205 [Eggerthella guodeyinii]|uniref:Uncharacterized protein n=1 Tax=Eggerthella guodeyinii TaxID=2690837 RepID=A0A6L7IYY0_9ACTN|nr:hypothetical protein [Eggerthella guodeyinii]QOS69245.1 hypothetical protein GS424_005205 [Eggerthella guodeyinii]